MAGNTGKMTVEAIRARGPRMRLLAVESGSKTLGFVICREGEMVFNTQARFTVKDLLCRTYAKSYTLKYLLSIGKNQGAAHV